MYPKPWQLEVLLLRNPSANVYSVYVILGTASPRWGENISVQYPTFQEGASQAAKGSFLGGGGEKSRGKPKGFCKKPLFGPKNPQKTPGNAPPH